MNHRNAESPGAVLWAMVLCVGLLLAPISAAAQEVTLLLVLPSGTTAAGTRQSVWLYGMNESSAAVRRTFQQRLDGSLSWASGQAHVYLTLAKPGDETASIESGGFAKREYTFIVPRDALGTATLSVGTFNELALHVEAGPRPDQTAQGGPPKGPSLVARAKPLFGSFLESRVAPYEPIFFIIGNHPSVEFQFSLKAKLLDLPDADFPAGTPYFGYTQVSYWDLLTSDPSFYDTSYKPSFFLYKRNIRIPGVTGTTTWLDGQYGYEHESNGEGGTTERSLNTVYVQPTLTFVGQDDLRLTLQPRVWYYLSVGRYDQNLAAYRGYANLRTALTWNIYQLAAKFQMGDRDAHASGQLDLRVDLSKTHWDPALQIQYFRGYGETLRDYDRIDNGLRVGFSLWYPTFDGP